MSQFDLASQPQINLIKKLVWDHFFEHDNDFYHQVNMGLKPKNLLKSEAGDLIDELKKDNCDLQYTKDKLLKVLKQDMDVSLAKCTKCGDIIKSDEDSLCANCI